MEKEREYTLRMDVHYLKNPETGSPASSREIRLIHYQTLDEAFMHLYTTDLNRLDSRIALAAGEGHYIEHAAITRKEGQAPLMFLSEHTYARKTARNEWNWPYKTVLAVEKGNNEHLLSAELYKILNEHVPGLSRHTGIALAEYNRTKERLNPAIHSLMRVLEKRQKPPPPLLANYGYILQIEHPENAILGQRSPRQVREKTPLNDLAYGMYQLSVLPLHRIGTDYTAAIMNWDNTFPQIALRRVTEGKAESGLYLDFHSEIHRFLAEATVHPVVALSKDPLALSVRIGSYNGHDGLTLTPAFDLLKERLKEHYIKKMVSQRPGKERVIAPDPGKKQRRGL